MPVSSLKWTFATVFARTAASEMSCAVAQSMTGRTTPARTIAGISSGSTDERICTSMPRPFGRTSKSSLASYGSATPKFVQPAAASARA